MLLAVSQHNVEYKFVNPNEHLRAFHQLVARSIISIYLKQLADLY